MHGETTSLAYDSQGRLAAVYRPDATLLGVPEAAPSLQIAYDLDASGARPYAVVHSTSLSGASIAGSSSVAPREAWTYVDGAGRTVVSIEQADPAAGDAAPWVVRGLTQRDARGNPQRVYTPWFSTAPPAAYPLTTPPATSFTAHQYDAFGREIRSIDTAGDASLERHYHALAIDAWDAADLRSTVHGGTYATSRQDGHGRSVSAIERAKVAGVLTASETRTDYLPTGEAVRITRTAGGASVVRWMIYDSLGRLVENVDPHTSKNFSTSPSSSLKALRYAYDDAGELVGTSDARGCGINFFCLVRRICG